ncbi:NucA/NucB deoxyribonuclease domain-containing protein [Streptomyces uncialis]|uniref:NucA/NucB deoxyribonuclease domain-containing protein n=1 Tax=Streptomyces uncialis TaxID=1048205 RepID=UPI002F912953|nr:hypothetical protein OG268_36920 [Streptomyces uncialis]
MTTFQRICTAGVSVVALAAATLTPAQAAAPAADRLSIRVSVGEPGGMSASAATCRVNRIVITRYESCAVADAMVTLLRNGRPVGNAKFKITHTMKLKQKSRKWSETTAISRATLTNASGIRVAYTATCKGTCKTTNRVPQGRALGTAFSGKVNYVNNVKKNKKHTTETTYRFVFTKPGFTAGEFSYKSAKFRCDDMFWNRANTARTLSAGCAHATFTPTMTTMATLPQISRNIRAVQSRGQRLGVPGGTPLTRLADPVRIQANRDAVCPRSQRPPRPGLSCDEYPFASTRQGGTSVPASSRGTAWVPEQEQDQQGGRIAAFQKSVRLLDRDAFWVKV